jgi:hypothetical protein
MERAIVTVRDCLSGDDGACDLEIPADLPAERLVELLQGVFGASGRRTVDRIVTRVVLRLVRPEEPALELRPGQSLADVGAWDGSVLELAGVRDEREVVPVGPVQKWESLLDNLAEVDELATLVVGEQSAVRPNEKGFVRKRID